MQRTQRILVTGGNGLLGQQLKTIAPRDFQLFFPSHAEFDLTNIGQMVAQLTEFKPHIVINTAAYNLVDQCETERVLSWSVNAEAPETLAALCAREGIRLVHYSADHIFDGAKKKPYVEKDVANPLNHYAAGKFMGEQAVLRASPKNLVLRTSRVFDWHPTQAKTFVHVVLKAAREGRPLQAATDQVSVPTYANDLAEWTLELLRLKAKGLYHAVNDEGVSQSDWAKIILDEAVRAKLLPAAPPVEPVLSSSSGSTMRQPDYTVMSNKKLAKKLGHPAGSWRGGLRKMLARMKQDGLA